MSLVLGVFWWGCGGTTETKEVAIDLVDEFALAMVRSPTRIIDFGTPGALPHEVLGFHGFPLINEGFNGNWSKGEAAEIEFFVSRIGDLPVYLRCSPVLTDGGSYRIELGVNGRAWEGLDLLPGMRDYQLLLPATLLRLGTNRLLIRHSPRPGPPASLEKDVRVLWDAISLGAETPRTPTAPAAVPEANGAIMAIPVDFRVDFFLDLPADARLQNGSVALRGATLDTDARLVVIWQESSTEQEVVLTEDLVQEGRMPLRIARKPQSGRLSFFALQGETNQDPGGGDGLFRLSRPTVIGQSRAEDGRVRVATAGAPLQRHPNIVVYLVDTLRADHLGCYGYDLPTSPHLDEFAKRAVLFENAQAQSPWTRPSVASILTGMWPQIHSVNSDADVLSEDALTLAEILHQLGYETAAVVANGNTSAATGFAQGFDQFDLLVDSGRIFRATEVNEAAVSWLDGRSTERPFFLYLHTVDPHAPYQPEEPFRSRFASGIDPAIATIERLVELQQSSDPPPAGRGDDLVALYDGEIAANDAAFGELLDVLANRGLFDETVVVFISDHGEEFYEHGSFQHGKNLYAETLRVPLLVRLPGMEFARRVTSIVQQVDLLPTILAYLGDGGGHPGGQGHSLLPLITGEASASDWEDRAVAYMQLRGRRASSLLVGRWKMVQRWAYDADVMAFPELYDEALDPLDARNLAPDHPDLALLYSVELRRLRATSHDLLRSEKVDEEAISGLEEQLRALGYIE